MVGDCLALVFKTLLTFASAFAWNKWENSTSKLIVDPAHIKRGDDQKW